MAARGTKRGRAGSGAPPAGGSKRRATVKTMSPTEAWTGESHGSPGVVYTPGLWDATEAEAVYRDLCKLPWRKVKYRNTYSKAVGTPRATTVFGGCEHGDKRGIVTFKGVEFVTQPMPPVLRKIADAVTAVTGRPYNMALCNAYTDKHSCISWHRDDQRDMHPEVVSLTFGRPQTFDIAAADGTVLRCELGAGSMLQFAGEKHQVPKRACAQGARPRLNVTLRFICSEEQAGNHYFYMQGKALLDGMPREQEVLDQKSIGVLAPLKHAHMAPAAPP